MINAANNSVNWWWRDAIFLSVDGESYRARIF